MISRYALRDGRTQNAKDILNSVVVPLCGFIAVFAIWLEVDETSLKYGLWWAMFGILYLGYKTKGFKHPAPQHNEFDDNAKFKLFKKVLDHLSHSFLIKMLKLKYE